MKMRTVHIILFIFAITSIIFVFLYFYYNILISLAASFCTIVGFFIAIFSLIKQEREIKKYEEIIELYRQRNKELIKKYEIAEKNVRKIFFEKEEIKGVVNKINFTLKKENLSKDKIIKELDFSIKSLLLMKTSEDIPYGNRRILTSNIDRVGFKHVDKGVYVLPPVKTPDFENNEEIEKWITELRLRKLMV